MSDAIVILGGFLAPGQMYDGLRAALGRHSGWPVSIVPTIGYDWLPSIARIGWTILLRALDRAIRTSVNARPHHAITLVCHSAGGLIARLYVSGLPVLGRRYERHRSVSRIVTLGTPHYHSHRRRIHGGMLSSYANDLAPGAFRAPAVHYASVAGKALRGNPHGTLAERHADDFYRRLNGGSKDWGDGLVPLASALLDGAQHIVLDGVAHGPGLRARWYGTDGVVAEWWPAILAPSGTSE